MKPKFLCLLAASLIAFPAHAAVTQTYNDATGEIATPGSGPHIDIASVTVSYDEGSDTLSFKINLVGNPVETDWGKYMIGIRAGEEGATTGNGWGRPINFASGMTHWIGSWVDGGNGAQLWSYNGGWNEDSATYGTNPASLAISKDSSSVTLSLLLAGLGLSAGDSFTFDVYTSGGGGGDGAVDALSSATTTINNWGDSFTTTAPLAFSTQELTELPLEWLEQYFTPAEIAAGDITKPGDDPDTDGLTNLEEFQLGTNPRNDDTDGDGVKDGLEVNGYVWNPVSEEFEADPEGFKSNPALADTDGDGFEDGAEASGSALGYVSDPAVPNYTEMFVAGTFNGFSTDNPDFEMTQGDTADLNGQYQWSLDVLLGTVGTGVEYKYVSGGFPPAGSDWGSGGGSSVIPNGGGNIQGFVGPSGIYRFTLDQRSLTQSFTRVVFDDYAAFRAAYGLTGADESQTADANGDGFTDYQNFQNQTNPLVADTDGDGISDAAEVGAGTDPLMQHRNITFSVDMNVQIAAGNYDPDAGLDVKLLVFSGPAANFENPLGGGGYDMSDDNSDGIYTVTISDVPGFAGQPFGEYKFFFISEDPETELLVENYEQLSENPFENRTLDIGAATVEQVVPKVFFSNDSGTTGPTYAAWAAQNAGGQGPDEDYDNDGVPNGVEYFMGETGSSFTANPHPDANGVISWPRDPNVTDATPKVQTSEDLVGWDDVELEDLDQSDPNFVRYTLPTGSGTFFVRLKVTVDEDEPAE